MANHEMIAQTPGMDEEARAEFLGHFQDDGDTRIGDVAAQVAGQLGGTRQQNGDRDAAREALEDAHAGFLRAFGPKD